MNLEWAVHVRPFPGAPRGGDTGVVRLRKDDAILALVDATGHGLEAYAVAQAARRVLHATTAEDPGDILRELDDALAGGLGAAISVACLHDSRLTFAGVGNVSASVDLRPLVVRTGVVGSRMRTPSVETRTLAPDTWLLLHTDGVSSPDSIPAGNAETAAKLLVERHGSQHDDAAALLARLRTEA